MASRAPVMARPEPVIPPPPDVAALLTGGYAELKRRIVRAGLLERQPAYYRRKILFTFLLPVPSLVLLAVTRNPWIQAGNAVYLACVFAQFSFLGHDVGHLEVVRAGRAYTFLTLL